MKRRIVLVLAMAFIAMSTCAYAMPVNCTNGVFTATAVKVSDGSPYSLTTNSFQILGTNAEGEYLIYADGQYLKLADGSVLQPIFNATGDVVKLPTMADYQPLARSMKGDAVLHFQENMQKLGYLNGVADGDFGGMSESAVSMAQQALGMEVTGVADVMLQMLFDSMTANPVSYSVGMAEEVDAASLFDTIADETDANLDKAREQGMDLWFDDIEGVGMISDGNTITYSAPVQSEIDIRTFTVSFGMYVIEENGGTVSVVPVMNIKCKGVQRPAMQEVTLKSGHERHAITVDSVENSLDGLNAVEEAIIPLDDETVAMLAGVAEANELKIRIACKYNTYDIVVSENKLPTIASMGEAMKALHS